MPYYRNFQDVSNSQWLDVVIESSAPIVSDPTSQIADIAPTCGVQAFNCRAVDSTSDQRTGVLLLQTPTAPPPNPPLPLSTQVAQLSTQLLFVATAAGVTEAQLQQAIVQVQPANA